MNALHKTGIFTHIILSIHQVVTVTDEKKQTRQDWRPGSILVHVCNEQEDDTIALKCNIKALCKCIYWCIGSNESVITKCNPKFCLRIDIICNIKDNNKIKIPMKNRMRKMVNTNKRVL